jgi:hypothetical protein
VAKKPLRGGVAEFRVISYDGEILEGRVLLGATVDPLVIDGRLIESTDVQMDSFRACDSKDWLKHIDDCILSRPPQAGEIITISPGYWYGGKVKFWPFDKEQTGLGPDCFEAELVLRVLDGRVAATLPIRVVRTDKPPTPPDGGTEQPKPPASDAGAP